MLLGALLLLAVVVAYLPSLNAGYIWDDDLYVTDNPLLTAPDGLTKIWFSAHHQSQYFPLVFTTLRFERWVWGLNPAGYHAVNVLLHAANALLAWALLRRLALPGAWLGAAIFALHPVQVESVAWITELKNTESTLFYLLALLAWLRFNDKEAPRRGLFYALALVLQALALFSKTTACTLPAAMLLVLWVRKEPIRRRTLLLVTPFVALAGGMGLLSVWWEGHLGNYCPESGISLTWVERFLVATRAVWFYAGKFFWPVDLTFSYPRWRLDAADPLQYSWALGCVAVAALLWWKRDVLGRAPAALAFFVAALSPLLGLIPLYTFRYSFVADHYQYLALLGLTALVAAAVSSEVVGRYVRSRTRTVLMALLLATLAALTWNQTLIYKNSETLWTDTARKNPASWMALNYLGFYAQARGDMSNAVDCFRRSLELYPSCETHNNFGKALAAQGQLAQAAGHFREASRLDGRDPVSHMNLGALLAQHGNIGEAIAEYQRAVKLAPGRASGHYALGTGFEQAGQSRAAIGEYREALRLNPNSPDALRNLASLLASDPDPALRNGAEAVRLAQRACELTDFREIFSVSVLATALAETGRFKEAAATARRAEQMAQAAGDRDGAQANRRLAEMFQAGQPYHDPPRTGGPAVQ